MKKFFEEFKTFALKGNVLDMAIGVIIGSEFSKIVSSLVNDIFLPLIAVILGDVQFSSLAITLKGSGEDAITWNYGAFIQNVLNFAIVALCLFLFVRFVNKLKELTEKKAEEESAPEEPKESEELKALNKIVSLLEEKPKRSTAKTSTKKTEKN